ncbi:MAG: hypothetical protein V3V53_12175 [Bacteroidales bacterium]
MPSYVFYKIFAPVYPVLRFLFPKTVTNTEEVGRAMINAVLVGADKQTLETRDIIELAKKT